MMFSPPITWFLTPLHSYWLAKLDQAEDRKYLKGIWVVLSYGVSLEERQWASLSLIDANAESIVSH